MKYEIELWTFQFNLRETKLIWDSQWNLLSFELSPPNIAKYLSKRTLSNVEENILD